MPWLTEIVGGKVIDPSGARVGRVRDVLGTRGRYPGVVGLLISSRRETLFAPIESLETSRPRRIIWNGQSSEAPEGAMALVDELLDRQIVDVEGARVVRVNDILLSPSGDALRVVAADVGTQGVLRRLGVLRPAEKLVKALGYEVSNRIIGWNYLIPLEEGPSDVRLTVPNRLLRELRPGDLADLLDELDPDRRESILRVMSVADLAVTLPETEPETSVDALEAVGEQRTLRVLEHMPPDEAADLLGILGYERSQTLLGLMGVRRAEVLRELLGYPPDTAGGRMTPEMVRVPEDATVARAVSIIREAAARAETINYAYVTDSQGRLLGVISLRDLLRSSESRPVSEVMEGDVISVDVLEDQEVVAHIMAKYNLLALPVVSEDRQLVGIITADDVVEVYEEEATEDLAEVSGIYLGVQGGGRTGRLAGFAVSLIAGTIAAAILRSQTELLLAFAGVAWLLPLFLRTGQDLGTWSLARSLRLVGVTPRARLEVLSGELLAGLVSAVLAGAIVGGFVGLLRQQASVGFGIGVGLAVGSLAASLIGLGLPSLMKAAGIQRVLARGRPLAAIVGIASLMMYLWAIASLSSR